MAAAVAALLVPLSTWFLAVDQTVTEPYLDEVFHIRQAQHYCQGHWDVWDPKITTPPGLYLLSQIASRVPLLGCDIFALRTINGLGIVALLLLARAYYIVRNGLGPRKAPYVFNHAALNVALFPLLFFFSALYYTDIWSTAFVLLFYLNLRNAYNDVVSPGVRFVKVTALGIIPLFFRQTNIFWVAIMPAALVLIQQLDSGHQAVRTSMYRGAEGFGDSLYNVAKTAWKMEVIWDTPIRDASMNDYLWLLITLAACSFKVLTKPKRMLSLLSALSPFIALLALFAGFVFWNGGVVLGDKGNHVTTLHTPQILYFWPFLAFFSWPYLYPYLLLVPVSLVVRLPTYGTLESLQIFKRSCLLQRPWLTVPAIGLACVVVYFNTIVHPFTLADNRHYIFYVFRLLMNPWWMRYAVTPIYFLAAWSSMQVLGGGPPQRPPDEKESADGVKGKLPLPNGEYSATISFAVTWLATSTLQLVTAPLVEPRYFILPWLFWRLHVPLRMPPESSSNGGRRAEGKKWAAIWEDTDYRQWIETIWLLAVNVGTGYVFLMKGFEWPQEPGKVQRFMW